MVSDIVKALSALLKQLWPDTCIYDTPIEQGMKLPCFLILLHDIQAEQRVDNITDYDLSVQIVALSAEVRVEKQMKELKALMPNLLRSLNIVHTDSGSYRPRELSAKVGPEELRIEFVLRCREQNYESGPVMEREQTKTELKE